MIIIIIISSTENAPKLLSLWAGNVHFRAACSFLEFSSACKLNRLPWYKPVNAVIIICVNGFCCCCCGCKVKIKIWKKRLNQAFFASFFLVQRERTTSNRNRFLTVAWKFPTLHSICAFYSSYFLRKLHFINSLFSQLFGNLILMRQLRGGLFQCMHI